MNIVYVFVRPVSNRKQDMPKTNAHAKFEEHPSINSQVIERKLSAHGPSDGRTDTPTASGKTLYLTLRCGEVPFRSVPQNTNL